MLSAARCLLLALNLVLLASPSWFARWFGGPAPYLIATVQSALSDADLLHLRDGLVEKVGRFRSRGVIVDVTAMDVMDSFASRTLRDIVHMIRLRGAETVVVGFQPEVALAMVQLGLTLEGVATALRHKDEVLPDVA